MPSKTDFKLGQLAIKRGYTNRDEVNECLRALIEAEALGVEGNLAGVLIKKRFLNEGQLSHLINELAPDETEVQTEAETEAIPLNSSALESVENSESELERITENSETKTVASDVQEELKRLVEKTREKEYAPTEKMLQLEKEVSTASATVPILMEDSTATQPERVFVDREAETEPQPKVHKGTSRVSALRRETSKKKVVMATPKRTTRITHILAAKRRRRERRLVSAAIVITVLFCLAIGGYVSLKEEFQLNRHETGQEVDQKEIKKVADTNRQKAILELDEKMKELEYKESPSFTELMETYKKMVRLVKGSHREKVILSKIASLKKRMEKKELSSHRKIF